MASSSGEDFGLFLAGVLEMSSIIIEYSRVLAKSYSQSCSNDDGIADEA